eukprot:6465964-Amphidinium_carterae.1
MKFFSELPLREDGFRRTVGVREPGPPALVDAPRQASASPGVGGGDCEVVAMRFLTRESLE